MRAKREDRKEERDSWSAFFFSCALYAQLSLSGIFSWHHTVVYDSFFFSLLAESCEQWTDNPQTPPQTTLLSQKELK